MFHGKVNHVKIPTFVADVMATWVIKATLNPESVVIVSGARTARDILMLKWEYNSFGNFSTCYGWDNGLASNITSKAKPAPGLNPGVYCEFFNEHGGSRNAYGYVVASSRKKAKELLKHYDMSYSGIEEEVPELCYE